MLALHDLENKCVGFDLCVVSALESQISKRKWVFLQDCYHNRLHLKLIPSWVMAN